MKSQRKLAILRFNGLACTRTTCSRSAETAGLPQRAPALSHLAAMGIADRNPHLRLGISLLVLAALGSAATSLRRLWWHWGLSVGRLRRTARWAASATLLLSGSLAASGGELNVAGELFPAVELPETYRGQMAVAALGQHLSVVANWYGFSGEELRKLLLSDYSLHVDASGRLFYACQVTNQDAEAKPDADMPRLKDSLSTTSESEVFRLHSRPGATKVIYLDFDGHVTTGTQWNSQYGPTIITPAFDLDNDPTRFIEPELHLIRRIWAEVAEHFAPFDVNVTTEDPGTESLRKTSADDQNYGVRVCIGGKYQDWYKEPAGGVAYVGSFLSDTDTPCFAFARGGTTLVVSHEVGHTLGLRHDGKSCCTPNNQNDGSCCYYDGHGHWGPIMGAPWSRPLVQWSKGEYAGANNLQDDLMAMQSHGLAYRPDDHANHSQGATLLTGAGVMRGSGVIETRSDIDWFRFPATSGVYRVYVQRGPFSPLHPEVTLYSANAASLLRTADRAGDITFSSDSFWGGMMYVAVRGTGFGDPATDGYSDYGSLGSYSVTVTPLGQMGEFVCQPVSAVALEGDHVQFEVGVRGANAVSYQWHKAGVGPLTGRWGSVLDLYNVRPVDAGSYFAVAYTPPGMLTSVVATLTVNYSNAYAQLPADGTLRLLSNQSVSQGNTNTVVGLFVSGTRLLMRDNSQLSLGGPLVLGLASGSGNNLLDVFGVGVNLTGSHGLDVGAHGSRNQFRLTAGGQAAFGGDIILGREATSWGNTVTASGQPSLLTSSGALTVGAGGWTNALMVLDAGRVASQSAVIGEGCSASLNRVTINGLGSVWSNATSLSVGKFGLSNSLVLSSGGVLWSDTGLLGIGADARHNRAVVTDPGTVWHNRSRLTVGDQGSSNLVEVSKGGRLQARAVSLGEYFGSRGNQLLVLDTNSACVAEMDLVIGGFGASNAMVIGAGGRVASQIGSIGSALEGGGGNTVRVEGALSSWENAFGLTVGNSAHNSLSVSHSGTVATASLVLGVNLGSTQNVAHVTGAGSLLSANTLTVGNIGSRNELHIGAGGRLRSEYAEIGSVSGQNQVTVFGAGSRWDNAGDVLVGNWFAAPSNTLWLADGAVVTSSNLYAGWAAGSDDNLIRVDGGTLAITNATRTGTLDVRRGRFEMNGGWAEVDHLISTNRNPDGLLNPKHNSHLALNAGTLLLGSGHVQPDPEWAMPFEIKGLNIGSGNLPFALALRTNGTLTIAGFLSVGQGHDGPGATSLWLTNGGRLHVRDHVWIGPSSSGRTGVLAVISGPGASFTNGSVSATYGNYITVSNSGVVRTRSSVFHEGNQISVVGEGSSWSNRFAAELKQNNTVQVLNGGIWDNEQLTLEFDNHLLALNGSRVSSRSAELKYNNGAEVRNGGLWDSEQINLTGWSNRLVVADAGSRVVTGPGDFGFVGPVSLGFNRVTVMDGARLESTQTVIGTGWNYLLVLGDGAQWINASEFWLQGVSNVLRILNEGALTTGRLHLGENPTSDGHETLVAGTGARLHARQGIVVGADGSFNHLRVSGFGFAQTETLVVGSRQGVSNTLNVARGTLCVTNGSGTGLLHVNRGQLHLSSGLVHVDALWLTNRAHARLAFHGGQLAARTLTADNGEVFRVGDGEGSATLELLGGTATFADGLVVSSNSILAGHGLVHGPALIDGAVSNHSGNLVFTGTVTNRGRLVSRGTVIFRGPLHNEGQIEADGGTVLFEGVVWNHGYPMSPATFAYTNFAGLPGSAGAVNGTGSGVRFNYPVGIALDSDGNLYVADYVNHLIRKVSPAGVSSTFAGTTGMPGHQNGAIARFNTPQDVAVDAAGNVYVADLNNHVVRQITPAGNVSTLAGQPGSPGHADGPGTTARFNLPVGIACDPQGNLYVVEYGNHTLRRIGPGGEVSTVAGLSGWVGSSDGLGPTARFAWPQGVTVDAAGVIYVADSGNHTIRRVTPAGDVSTLAGLPGFPGHSDEVANLARFSSPIGLAADRAGNVFVGDFGNGTVRKLAPGGVVSTVGGSAGVSGTADGIGMNARFASPGGLAVTDTGTLFVADSLNHRISLGTPLYEPTLLSGPQDQGVKEGRDGVFSVVAHGHAPLYYQWLLNGNPIANATNSTLHIVAASDGDEGDYQVVVLNPYGTATSQPARLTVLPAVNLTPPELSLRWEERHLVLEWPLDRLGWRLQRQTPTPGGGVGMLWEPVPDSQHTNRVDVSVGGGEIPASSFYRLVYP